MPTMHQDLDITDYYLYKGTFSKRTNEGFYVQWHDGTAGGWTPASKRGDNPNLGFITREEFRAGIDATLFNRLLKINVNYFRTRYERLAHPRFIFYLSFLFCFKQQFHFHALDQL